MDFIKNNLFSKHYGVRLRLFAFVIWAILLVIFISITAIIGLNNTYNSLSDLREKSLNQMFSSMTLGVKTAQISTYATRLNQTINALQYKEESELLAQHAQQLQNLLNYATQNTQNNEDMRFTKIVDFIGLLEKSVKELLLQAHNRHITHTHILSGLSQNLLYIQHIKRLDKKFPASQEFRTQLAEIENLIEDTAKTSFSSSIFSIIKAKLSELPVTPSEVDIDDELAKLKNTFSTLIEDARLLSEVNLRIKFLTYQIDALVKQIDVEYSLLAQEKVKDVNTISEQIQSYLSDKTTSIIIFAAVTIALIIILGWYIYSLIGKRLYSITQALKKFSQGDKTVSIPQQQSPDEIGDLARAFHSFQHDLVHSQKMQTMGHLTGGIAHDFNNLLAVIIGNLDLIDPDTLTEKQAQRLNRALKAAENSATLTQRLLAYARKQPLHPTELDINQLIMEFQDFIKHSLPPSIKVRLNLEENLPLTYMDKNQLETALVNLIVNAKDAMNDIGNITIQSQKLMVQRTHHSEEMLQISISDEGCGMDEETQKRIFEPFFTTKKNGKGSGLGLSMVYGFIRQSKGRVVVESQINKGTTIHLQLPIAEISYEKQTTLTHDPLPLSAKIQSVLLVEDQHVLRETLTEQLKSMGYHVTGVESGEQALNYLKSGHRINYLLSDIILADKITGIDVANFVHQHCPSVKILLMTGNHTNNLAKSTQYPILNKPFKQAELQQTLNEL
ncbi:signal transduction histidine kinase [Cricetibacter osteomyelitidis]|uniref:histidine kinase n=1 Tax=Cricetibacter osteomyelitidis TaxID=1521931 RepID=A0A4R2SSK6_9PAST|nr:hybrid sensor histidine kinase/response regulator [Cricetibacter osteomyelitidis]TCP91234.1 signal transduction histidine kinase [Cricetibacter osteomyelitidis]